MKLRNTTDFPDHFLRRMVTWCCKEIDLPVRCVKIVQVSRYSRSRRGTAYPWRGKVRLMIGAEDRFPGKGFNYHGAMTPDLADRIEGLIEIAAHELLHLLIYADSRGKQSGREAWIVMQSHRVLDVFRANRETLLAEWNVAPAERERPVVPIAEKRQAKVQADLDRWKRKLKLAQTKIRKLRRRAAYYERKAAAKPE